MAGPTGFEPAISSVTGRRDRPTSLRARNLRAHGAEFRRSGYCKDLAILASLPLFCNRFAPGNYAIMTTVTYADIAQLVERRFRKA